MKDVKDRALFVVAAAIIALIAVGLGSIIGTHLGEALCGQ